jgi:hypothetical protein
MAVKSRSSYVSKGKHPTRSKANKRLNRAGRTFGEAYQNKLDAWAKGKKVFFTIENPNKNETNRRMIRVPAVQYLGHYRQPNNLKKSGNNANGF